MKKIIFMILILSLVISACATKRAVDYEGQRKRAAEGHRDLDRE